MDEIGDDPEAHYFSRLEQLSPIPAPVKVADALRIYGQFLFVREQLMRVLSVNSGRRSRNTLLPQLSTALLENISTA